MSLSAEKAALKTALETYGKQIDLSVITGEETYISQTPLVVHDVSPIEHPVDVTLTSKNLLAYPFTGATKTENGVTFTDNGNGSITVSGTATADCTYIFNSYSFSGTYTLSGGTGGSASTYYLCLGSSDYADTGKGVTRAWETETTGDVFLSVVSGCTLDNLVIKPQLELGDTATAYTPYVSDFSSVTVKQNGKNQADIMGWTYFGENCLSSSIVKEGDSLIAQGNAGADGMAYSSGNLRLRFRKENGAYIAIPAANRVVTISIYATLLEQGKHDNRVSFYACTEVTTGGGGQAIFNLTVGERTKLIYTRPATATIDISSLIFRLNNNKVKVEMDTLQIEYGDTATEFEPYKTPTTYTADTTGTVEGMTSVSPSMTITSSSEGVTINAVYERAITFSSESVVGCNHSFEGSILTSIMKQAEIELDGVGGQSFAETIKGRKAYLIFGAAGGGVTAQRDYGTFIVKDAEYNDETNSVVLTCYDKMLLAMTEYKSPVNFPTEEGDETAPVTLGSYLQAICDWLGIKLATPTFTNSDVIIDEEKFDTSYTTRDVFTAIAQAAGGTIAIKNDELYVLYPTASDVKVEPSNLKSIKMGDLYGPVNSVVLARTPQEDNIYKKDETAEKICEIKIENNQLMDSHREDFIEGIYNALHGLTYYPHEVESYGIGILDICDLFTIETLDRKTYTALHLSGEVEITQGLVERTKGDAPAATETDYKAASETDRVMNKTILRVDKQEGIIQGLITSTTNIQSDLDGKFEEVTKSLEATMTSEEAKLLISETVNGIDSITTSTGYTFNADGLHINKSGEEIENKLDHTGMYVNQTDADGNAEENILTANNEGVNAVNLTARKYLIIGNNSRFEDYETNRTACFYIGG